MNIAILCVLAISGALMCANALTSLDVNIRWQQAVAKFGYVLLFILGLTIMAAAFYAAFMQFVWPK
jgi:hypothetical protein